jgi:CheY-like chemotaxis protein
VLARAVEPFFSTKGVGHGTGLGLSMVHGLMAQHGGAMTIESKPGLGTCVELWLPRADVATAPAAADPEAGGTRPAAGTALVVDDEPLVRASMAEMLVELGFAVVEAEGATEALRRIGSGLAVDLLVTDHLMPGMTGTELARTVRAIRPETAVLIVSGYAEVDELAPDLPRLTKPFRQEALAAMIETLGAEPVRGAGD